MKKHNELTYGIIGLGRFGTALAKRLSELGAEILVIDKSAEKIAEMRELTENAFITDSLDKKNLIDMGIQNCDIVIVCIAEALDVSILTVMKLQSIGVKHIIAKATSEEHGMILKKLGVEMVFPERDMAVRLANRLEIGEGLDFIELSETMSITKINVHESFLNKTVKDVNIREKFGLNIIAIENKGRVIDSVNPDYIFNHGDVIYLCGNKQAIKEATKWIENN